MKWFERRPERCEAELILIKEFYSKARIFVRKGRLVVFLKVLGRKANYIVKVVYPKDFPYSQPRAYIVEPKIKNAPHTWRDDGRLSIHEDNEGPGTSGKIILDLAKKWIETFENWLDTGKWPERIK